MYGNFGPIPVDFIQNLDIFPNIGQKQHSPLHWVFLNKYETSLYWRQIIYRALQFRSNYRLRESKLT